MQANNNRYMGIAQQPMALGQQHQANQAFAAQATMQRNLVLAGFNKPAPKGGKTTTTKKVEPVKEENGLKTFVKKNKPLLVLGGTVAAHYAYQKFKPADEPKTV